MLYQKLVMYFKRGTEMKTITVRLYSCMGCQKLIDNFMIASGKYSRCSRCGDRYFKPKAPRLFIILKYIMQNPVHVFKILWAEFRGQSYGA